MHTSTYVMIIINKTGPINLDIRTHWLKKVKTDLAIILFC
jgi:hypothetical protein